MPAPRPRAPRMSDVAAAAGVSHQTVSRVLNDAALVRPETRERVQRAIDELGYRRNVAARALVTHRSHRIGLISAHLSLYGPGMVVEAVQQAGWQAGYDVAMVALPELTDRAVDEAVRRLQDEAVEALVVAVAHMSAHDLVRGLRLSVPVVVAAGVVPGEPLAAGIDQLAGARLAVEHLLDLGHDRVAHLSGPGAWIEATQRRAGWEAAHADRGLEPGVLVEGDWSVDSGYAAGQQLLDDPAVTAVFAANDAMALGVLRAAHETGRDVPGALSVVGFDDETSSAYLWPGLTTVRQEFSRLGEIAVGLAVRAIDGEDEPTAAVLPPTLVVRESTAPPPS